MHLRLRRHLAGALAHRRARHRPHPGLLHGPDGQHRRILPLARLDVLERLGIPPEQLPPVRPSLSVLGPLQRRLAATLGLPQGIPVWSDPADTPAASYALGTEPGGRPLLIMGTTHVVSNALAAPDPRAKRAATGRRPCRPMADQRRHQRRRCARRRCRAPRLRAGRHRGRSPGRHRIQTRPDQMADAPVFIPHTRPERGPLWFAEPRTALLGAIPDPRHPQPPAESSKACCSPTG